MALNNFCNPCQRLFKIQYLRLTVGYCVLCVPQKALEIMSLIFFFFIVDGWFKFRYFPSLYKKLRVWKRPELCFTCFKECEVRKDKYFDKFSHCGFASNEIPSEDDIRLWALGVGTRYSKCFVSNTECGWFYGNLMKSFRTFTYFKDRTTSDNVGM